MIFGGIPIFTSHQSSVDHDHVTTLINPSEVETRPATVCGDHDIQNVPCVVTAYKNILDSLTVSFLYLIKLVIRILNFYSCIMFTTVQIGSAIAKTFVLKQGKPLQFSLSSATREIIKNFSQISWVDSEGNDLSDMAGFDVSRTYKVQDDKLLSVLSGNEFVLVAFSTNF